MRSPAVTLALLLLLGVALPIVLIQGVFGGRWPFGDEGRDSAGASRVAGHERSAGQLESAGPSPLDRDDGVPLALDGAETDTGAVGASAETAAISEVAVKVPQRYHFHGYFRRGIEEGRESILNARLAGGEREANTDENGAFTLFLAPQDFPVSVYAEEALLCRLGAAPKEASAYVNLHAVPASAGASTRGLLAPSGISAEETPEGYRIRIYGTTPLAPHHRLTVRLRAAEKSISENLCTVGEPPLLAELEARREDLFSGVYSIELAWRAADANAEELKQLSAYLPPALQGLPQGEVRAYLEVYLGRKYEEVLQEKEIGEFYEKALGSLGAARDLLLLAAEAGRGATEHKLTPAAHERLRGHRAYETLSRLKGGEAFPAARWRELIDKELPAYWEVYLQPGTVPYPKKYPALAQNLELACGATDRFSHLESRLQYQSAGIAAHPHDAVNVEFSLEDDWQIVLGQIDRYLREIKKELRRRGEE
ncbi:MAG: hypothetical protein L0Z55_12785 [Planctomycetes bacterium]|nr:hypothetical protein [Planctomycetota bacterium]